jgi:hypothetical protein
MVSDTDKLHTGAANPATTGEHFVGSTPSPATEAVRLVHRLRYWEGDGHPHGLLHRKAADRILALTEAMGRMREDYCHLLCGDGPHDGHSEQCHNASQALAKGRSE